MLTKPPFLNALSIRRRGLFCDCEIFAKLRLKLQFSLKMIRRRAAAVCVYLITRTAQTMPHTEWLYRISPAIWFLFICIHLPGACSPPLMSRYKLRKMNLTNVMLTEFLFNLCSNGFKLHYVYLNMFWMSYWFVRTDKLFPRLMVNTYANKIKFPLFQIRNVHYRIRMKTEQRCGQQRVTAAVS